MKKRTAYDHWKELHTLYHNRPNDLTEIDSGIYDLNDEPYLKLTGLIVTERGFVFGCKVRGGSTECINLRPRDMAKLRDWLNEVFPKEEQ